MPNMQIVNVVVRGELPQGCGKCKVAQTMPCRLFVFCPLLGYQTSVVATRDSRCPLQLEDKENEE